MLPSMEETSHGSTSSKVRFVLRNSQCCLFFLGSVCFAVIVKLDGFSLLLTYGNKVATTNFIPWPIEIQFCEPNASTNQTKSPPRCVVAYTSDLIFLQVSMNPHHRKNLKTSAVSLDHWMHFHWPLRADDCLLFVINSPAAYNARGFDSAKIFNRKREHVASATQEGLIRVIKNPIPPVTSKL
uniref:Acyl-CoA thioesterase 2 C-terminal domain-containing protein n=1 Tax=Quercus lobata TaxID=97700 RepID=A0A7N2LS78_QUELO